MEVSWSQNETPNKVWWALESSELSSTALSSPDVEDLRSPTSPTRSLGDSLRLEQSSIFYNYVDETDYREGEEELSAWLKDYRTRGVIRYDYATPPRVGSPVENRGSELRTASVLSCNRIVWSVLWFALL